MMTPRISHLIYTHNKIETPCIKNTCVRIVNLTERVLRCERTVRPDIRTSYLISSCQRSFIAQRNVLFLFLHLLMSECKY